jgi:hypothetical protein
LSGWSLKPLEHPPGARCCRTAAAGGRIVNVVGAARNPATTYMMGRHRERLINFTKARRSGAR